MATINPYIMFRDNCEEAFNFYKSVFSGEFTMLSRFSDMPENPQMKLEEGDENKVMHVGLPIGKDNVLMGSDSPASMPLNVGDNIGISFNADSEEEAEKIFNGISEGGKVTMPLQKTFWNAYFGSCTDKFGINWMVNYDYEEK